MKSEETFIQSSHPSTANAWSTSRDVSVSNESIHEFCLYLVTTVKLVGKKRCIWLSVSNESIYSFSSFSLLTNASASLTQDPTL